MPLMLDLNNLNVYTEMDCEHEKSMCTDHSSLCCLIHYLKTYILAKQSRWTAIFGSYHTSWKGTWIFLAKELACRALNCLQVTNEGMKNCICSQKVETKGPTKKNVRMRHTSFRIWWDLELCSFKEVSPIFLWAAMSWYNPINMKVQTSVEPGWNAWNFTFTNGYKFL